MATARASSSWVLCAAALFPALPGTGTALVAQEFLDLGDITAGGDGTGTGGGDQGDRDFTGVNIDTGTLMTEEEIAVAWGETVDTDGENPSPADDFIDSVFFITDSTMPINSEGVPFTFEDGDAFGASYNHVLSNQLLARPPELFIPTGTTEQLEITCLDENLIQTDVTSTVAYFPEPPGSITVDGSGLVSAVAPGFTELVVVFNDTVETIYRRDRRRSRGLPGAERDPRADPRSPGGDPAAIGLLHRRLRTAVPRIVDVIAKDPLEDVTIRLVNFNRYHTQPEGVVVYEASTVCGRLWEMGETALPALKLALEEHGSDPRMQRILERLLDRSGPLARQGDLVWK